MDNDKFKTIELKVQIQEKVYKKIYNHLSENIAVELCGVLVGDIDVSVHGQKILLIDGAIRGENSESQVAQVKFTQDTWAHIYNQLDEIYLGKKIVGWYHSHPGFGVFLSEMDLFIHNNFFSLPTQVAIVIDPKANQAGVFAYQNGDIKEINLWVGNKKFSQTESTLNGKSLNHSKFYDRDNEEVNNNTILEVSNKTLCFLCIILLYLLIIFFTNLLWDPNDDNFILNTFKAIYNSRVDKL